MNHSSLSLDTASSPFAALGIRITGVDDATFGQTGGLHSPTTPHECADPYIALNPYQRPILPLRFRRWSRTRRSPCRRMTLRSPTRRLTTIQTHHTTHDCPCSFAHTQLVPLAVRAQVPVCDAPLQPHPTAPCTCPCTNRVPLSSQRGYTADNLSGAPLQSTICHVSPLHRKLLTCVVLRAQRRASTRWVTTSRQQPPFPRLVTAPALIEFCPYISSLNPSAQRLPSSCFCTSPCLHDDFPPLLRIINLL